ncbi:hypothetical protein BTUL_0130g00100 [Botrytis tulipae]|uniref:Uncharacterized protein n=1 Tax=Botrytis tulipae TaxID=87230 RepID=A0A4Z1EJM7_9HELO|nr:hypothetical protein BTUL_0130g00100 [Botrytis tulipae]
MDSCSTLQNIVKLFKDRLPSLASDCSEVMSQNHDPYSGPKLVTYPRSCVGTLRRNVPPWSFVLNYDFSTLGDESAK